MFDQHLRNGIFLACLRIRRAESTVFVMLSNAPAFS
jgi:hypothetical protein